MAIHQKRLAREGWSSWTNRPRAERHYRWWGIAATRCELGVNWVRGRLKFGLLCRDREIQTAAFSAMELIYLDGEGLGCGVARVVAGREGVSGCFGWSYVDATGIRRPHGAGGRVERDLFGVGHAITKLGRLAAVDGWIAVERLNGELGAAHLFDGFLILLALLLRGGIASALFDPAIIVPAGKNNPADVDGDEQENRAGIDERIFPERFFSRRGRRGHERLLRFGGRNHGAADVPPGD